MTQVTTGSKTYQYRYDALGNRVARIENGNEKRFVGGLVETDSIGSITSYYVYGLGLISKITPSNQSYHYHFDGIGSTIAITNSLGDVVNKYAYDEFGRVLNEEETIPNPFKYVGQFGVRDEGNGLIYMRARYYDPEIGRFISKDPIGFAGGDLNLYAYVGNNPINSIDPVGLWYLDINITFGLHCFVGATGGVMINDTGIYPYLGLGAMTPGLGASLTGSASNPTEELNVGLQLAYIITIQRGIAFGKNGGRYWEFGLGGGLIPLMPFSGSLTGFYVFPPFDVFRPFGGKETCKR